MAKDTLELTDQEVLLHAHSCLQAHLPLSADGYICSTNDLLQVLLGVAANRGTLESVCADLVGTPDPQTIRGYCNEQLTVEELPSLERRLNAALAAEIPRCVRRQAREYVILNGLRVTLAIRFVLPEHAPVSVLDLLLRYLKKHGIRVGCL